MVIVYILLGVAYVVGAMIAFFVAIFSRSSLPMVFVKALGWPIHVVVLAIGSALRIGRPGPDFHVWRA